MYTSLDFRPQMRDYNLCGLPAPPDYNPEQVQPLSTPPAMLSTERLDVSTEYGAGGLTAGAVARTFCSASCRSASGSGREGARAR
jgi:hypothetical protein